MGREGANQVCVLYGGYNNTYIYLGVHGSVKPMRSIGELISSSI